MIYFVSLDIQFSFALASAFAVLSLAFGNAEVPATEPEESGTNPYGDNKKAIWKFIIQTLISILTAILTALGTTSCMGVH